MPTNAQPTLVLTQAVATEGYFPPQDGGGGNGFYMGSIRTFAGNFVPSGGAEGADGELLSISQNTALFSLFGTIYGGNGQTTFALPDLVGVISVDQRDGRGGSDQGIPYGSPTLNIVPSSLPPSSGGTGTLVDNDQPTLPIRYVMNTVGSFPSYDGAALDSIGMIQAFGGTFAPAGTVECDGRLLAIEDYFALFSLIGTTYGGDGESTFAVPDLRGRSIIGAGNGYQVGQVVGSSNSSIGLANLPAEMGGGGVPLDSRGPGLVLTQLIATEGYFPSQDGGFDNVMPALGEIVAFAGNFVPEGFMAANGQTMPINQNIALFSLLGTNYGGNGQTTFALPDLSGRAVLGTNDEAGSPQVGTASGSPTLTLTVDDFPALDFSGTAAGEALYGANQADKIQGLGGSDTLTGNGGNDVLDGGSGADVMKGGLGDDRYIVDHAGDQVIEDGDAGTDTVRSAINLVLAANVENLELGGTAAKGVGNALDNLITGNASVNTLEGGAGNDTLNGGAGADTMKGGIGEDIYVVDNAGDKIVENDGAGTDTVQSSVTYSLAGQYLEILVLTGSAAINGSGNSLANKITGNSAANVLNGGDGNDRLDGGGGADTLRGGLGNDTYVVDLATDQVFENNGEGLDTVEASISFSLAGQYIEVLKLTGTANINGTGNGLTNSLYGNSGNNLLNGGTGADEMRGGAGNDRYVVDNAGDKVFELDGEGSDTVEASVTFSLVGQYVEKLTLTGSAAINGTGNGLANVLTGNGAANQLAGGGGNDGLHGMLGSDVLTGGAGTDDFWFETALGATNVDQIVDFVSADDSIRLDRSIFTGIAADGALAANAFYLGTAAHDADDRIVYDKASGSIYYDADGVGGAAAVLFAKVAANTTLTAADFIAS